MRLLAISAALSLATAIAPAAWADEVTHWRLFVADHADPIVTVVDLDAEAPGAKFDLAAPATLYTTTSKAAVYAVQGSADRVSAIASGIAIDDHGDHGDITIAEPTLLPDVVNGKRPVHFVEHDGRIAIFFDDEGRAALVDETQWLSGGLAATDLVAAAPHHGVAAPVGAFTLLSRANAEDPSALPVGVDVFGADGKQVGDLHACPDLHGEATSGHTLAIACATGLLLVDEATDGPVIKHLPYATDLPQGKSTTLLGGVGMQYWLGNYGADRVAIIDPSADNPFRLVDLPARRVHFAVDPEAVRYAYVFTEDGKLNRLDVVNGTIDASVTVTEPYSMDGEWSLPRPRIAVAGSEIVVTDPLKGQLHVVDAKAFAVSRTVELGASPYTRGARGAAG